MPWAQERPQKPAAQAPERRGPPPGKCYMAVHITGLDPTLTLPELLQSIAETAPVGMVLSARLLPDKNNNEPKGPRKKPRELYSLSSNPHIPPPPPPPPSSPQKADIVFGNENAPYELRQRARDGTFLVRGRTPFVAVNSQLVFNYPKVELRRSRVLRIRGPPGVEGFSEEAIRAVLAADATAMEAVGALGVQSEPVLMREEEEEVKEGGEEGRTGGMVRVMEWRFFGTVQAKAFKVVLREHFGRQLEIANAPDPCWDYSKMAQYLRRMKNKGKVRMPFSQPPWVAPVVDPLAPVYPSYFLEVLSEKTEEPTGTEEKESQPASTNRG
ncbi:hypothetical protein VMCG_02720 [Cytospora schulzeri]|uniref:Uncharacterized protein n=1 Tax=Cytospora schulzeri TaxID=448051 RepID=A0A423WZ66_9PEZI|nr:hypothetical protein VMCG_02720 [Valsa malicola]